MSTFSRPSAQTAHDQTVNTLQHQADDLSHLGPAFDLLSQSERELSLPFTRMAKELDALRELFLKQVHDEHVSGLSSLLSFNAGMASSLKDVLKNRDHALTQYNKATALLDARTKERQKWQTQQANVTPREIERASGSGSGAGGMMGSLMARMEKMVDDPNKGAKLSAKVQEAERALEETKAKWETISGSVATEAEAYHKRTNSDFGKRFKEHVHRRLRSRARSRRSGGSCSPCLSRCRRRRLIERVNNYWILCERGSCEERCALARESVATGVRARRLEREEEREGAARARGAV